MAGVTPIYGIRHPNGTTKAKDLGLELGLMGNDIEHALQTAGVSPVIEGQIITAPSDAARNLYFGEPATESERLALQARGATTIRSDKGGALEVYLATYNAATNPQGATVPGWYAIAGGAKSGKVNQASDTGWLRVGDPGAIAWQPGWSGIINPSVPWDGVKYRLKNSRVEIFGPCSKSGGFGSLATALILPPSMWPAVSAVGMGMTDGTAAYAIVTPAGELKTTNSGTSQFSVGVTYSI